ncbi:MAG TPA: type IV pilus assembly protein PilM [Syntrophales bacterium]|nr:type IV pilus assembly protein PilM [Syntrophales bacterium]HOU77806.1 type IV pilus assembly protein PilM [Syntrophales bacterium]HPC32993.1 type IV pilus assembly protein PilM [Syntrophales bacterium]HQG34387.1 type IV pilus assembly protein PilM [Syntrophales bacterium]HQI36792.1 type IV pilus assembly protein PilM [Syntrophales bacterium]
MIDFKSLFAKKKEQGGAAPGAPAKGKESGAATLKDSKLGKSLQNLSQFDLKALFSGKKQFVGLDIGSSSLKLVEILGEKGSYTMNRFLMAPLEKGVIVDGVVAEVDTLAEAIKALFKNSGCQKKEIVASLSGHNVIIKKAPFPQMEEKELQETIRDEASKYLPFDNMDDVNFDFQVLGPSANNPHLNDVIIVATKKEMMDGYVEAVELAGLSLAIMDVDSFALETMYMENYDFEEKDVVVIANIGASITNLNVMRNATSIFTRDFTMGGNMITEAIESQFGVSTADAEKIKLFGPEGDEYTKGEFFRNTLMYLADPICGEIERSIDYFRSTYSDEDIKLVLLAGGGANIPGITSDLTQRLSVPVEIINPFRKIAYNRKTLDDDYIKEIAPIAAVGVGLALRKLGDK